MASISTSCSGEDRNGTTRAVMADCGCGISSAATGMKPSKSAGLVR